MSQVTKMSSPLKPPRIISTKDGTQELAWSLPNLFFAGRLKQILFEEAGVDAKLFFLKNTETVLVTASYEEHLSNHVIFACYVFHGIAKTCFSLNNNLRL